MDVARSPESVLRGEAAWLSEGPEGLQPRMVLPSELLDDRVCTKTERLSAPLVLYSRNSEDLPASLSQLRTLLGELEDRLVQRLASRPRRKAPSAPPVPPKPLPLSAALPGALPGALSLPPAPVAPRLSTPSSLDYVLPEQPSIADSRSTSAFRGGLLRNDVSSKTLQVRGSGKTAQSPKGSAWKKVQVEKSEPLYELAVFRGWEEMVEHLKPGALSVRFEQYVSRVAGERVAQLLVPHEDELLYRIATHRLFMLVSLLVILANTVFLACSIQADVRDAIKEPGTFPEVFVVLGTMFSILFLIEVIVRIAGLRMHLFFSEDSKWHQFDMIIAAAVILELAIAMMATNKRVESGLMIIRLSRLIRLARILRVIRGLQYFSELRLMVNQIGSSLHMLLWTLVLVLMCTFVVTLILMDGIAEWARAQQHSQFQLDSLFENFGSLPVAILNLIACVTGGMDWINLYEEVTMLNDIVRVVFLMYVAIMLFAVMNIVTAIYIEHAVKSGIHDSDHVLKEELANDEKFVKEMQSLFVDADEDSNGDLTFDELCGFLQDRGVRSRLKLLGLEVHEAWGLFRLLDVEDRGILTVEEFCYGCLRLRGSARNLDTATIMSDNKRIFQSLMTHIRTLSDGVDKLLSEVSDEAGHDVVQSCSQREPSDCRIQATNTLDDLC